MVTTEAARIVNLARDVCDRVRVEKSIEREVEARLYGDGTCIMEGVGVDDGSRVVEGCYGEKELLEYYHLSRCQSWAPAQTWVMYHKVACTEINECPRLQGSSESRIQSLYH